MKKLSRQLILPIILTLLFAGISSAQNAPVVPAPLPFEKTMPMPAATPPPAKAGDTAGFTLTIENLDGKLTRLNLADLSKLKRLPMKTSDHGKESSFEGYALVDVLKLGGIEFAEAMRGKNLTSYLLVEATDKYQVVFSMTELNPDFTDRVVIVADKRDGAALSEKDGPLKLVVPDEKKGARSVRQVVSFKVIRATGANK